MAVLALARWIIKGRLTIHPGSRNKLQGVLPTTFCEEILEMVCQGEKGICLEMRVARLGGCSRQGAERICTKFRDRTER